MLIALREHLRRAHAAAGQALVLDAEEGRRLLVSEIDRLALWSKGAAEEIVVARDQVRSQMIGPTIGTA